MMFYWCNISDRPETDRQNLFWRTVQGTFVNLLSFWSEIQSTNICLSNVNVSCGISDAEWVTFRFFYHRASPNHVWKICFWNTAFFSFSFYTFGMLLNLCRLRLTNMFCALKYVLLVYCCVEIKLRKYVDKPKWRPYVHQTLRLDYLDAAGLALIIQLRSGVLPLVIQVAKFKKY